MFLKESVYKIGKLTLCSTTDLLKYYFKADLFLLLETSAQGVFLNSCLAYLSQLSEEVQPCLQKY